LCEAVSSKIGKTGVRVDFSKAGSTPRGKSAL
jgi:hypothetical protein